MKKVNILVIDEGDNIDLRSLTTVSKSYNENTVHITSNSWRVEGVVNHLKRLYELLGYTIV